MAISHVSVFSPHLLKAHRSEVEVSGDDAPLALHTVFTTMSNRGRIREFVRARARSAGRRYEEARQAYREARDQRYVEDLPHDSTGRVPLVCRRYAERRTVTIDEAAHPSCFEADHPDCEGCREDIITGHIETWDQQA